MSVMDNQVSTTRLIIVIGFVLGLLVSWSLLIGDQQGRVNLFHLLSIYIFLPIVSLLLSSTTILWGKGLNLANIASYLPFWSRVQKQAFLSQKNQPASKWYFYYQSQVAALFFSLASLLVLVVLLLSTDVNFVWRSTLLEAEHVYPVVKFLAMPWFFWESAQPSMELLLNTQDSRLSSNQNKVNYFSDWWQFILAAQICYTLILRLLAMFISGLVLANKRRSRLFVSKPQGVLKTNLPSSNVQLAEITTDCNESYTLVNWGGIEGEYLAIIEGALSANKRGELCAGPTASESEQMVAERWQDTQLVLVKGWEPPLAELSDYLHNGKGYLLPLDWSSEGIKLPKKRHLDEWRRFIAELPQWKLLQLEKR